MQNTRWLYITLLSSILLASGCDRVKSYLQGDGGSDTLPPPYSSGQGTNKPDSHGNDGNGGSNSHPIPAPPRNEPVFYDAPRPGEFAILMDSFKKREKAEDYSRYLRRQRVNNYLYRVSREQYLVLVGHFVSRSQAEKQRQVLSRKGLGHLKIYPQ